MPPVPNTSTTQGDDEMNEKGVGDQPEQEEEEVGGIVYRGGKGGKEKQKAE